MNEDEWRREAAKWKHGSSWRCCSSQLLQVVQAASLSTFQPGLLLFGSLSYNRPELRDDIRDSRLRQVLAVSYTLQTGIHSAASHCDLDRHTDVDTSAFPCSSHTDLQALAGTHSLMQQPANIWLKVLPLVAGRTRSKCQIKVSSLM